MTSRRSSADYRTSGGPAARLVGEVRRAWRRRVLLRSGIASLLVLLLLAAALAALDLLVSLPAASRFWLAVAVPAVALTVFGHGLGRVLRARDARRFALLAEERLPGLDNRLVTALDADAADRPAAHLFRARMDRELAKVDAGGAVPLQTTRPATALATMLTVCVALALLFPGTAAELWNRWTSPVDASAGPADAFQAVGTGIPLFGGGAGRSSGFGALRWTVRPPAYTGLDARRFSGDDMVSALAGSRIRVEGGVPGGGAGVRARTVPGRDLGATVERGGWSAEWTLALGERGVDIAGVRGDSVVARRIIPIVVSEDDAPNVSLRQPDADMVVPASDGHVPIRATARDEFGVGEFRLGWIRTRGSGESYTFEEGEYTWSEERREGAGTVHGALSLDLTALDLQPGDVLHLRAMARDRNDATGPGEGVSETRTIRIARADEMHTVTDLIGIPLEGDEEPILSQRMLIIQTEALSERLPGLNEGARMREGRRIGDRQARLRGRTGTQIFTHMTGGLQGEHAHVGFEDEHGPSGGHVHDHDAGYGHDHDHDDPEAALRAMLEEASAATGLGLPEEYAHDHDEGRILSIDEPRLDAYNAMWKAERRLNQGDPERALPHQYRALEILQSLEESQRVFARGRVTAAPVDVPGVRGTGDLHDVVASARSAGGATADAFDARAAIDRAAGRLNGSNVREAAETLHTLAASLLLQPDVDPRIAAGLSAAADAAAEGDANQARRRIAAARALLDAGAERGSAAPIVDAEDGVGAAYLRRLGDGN